MDVRYRGMKKKGKKKKGYGKQTLMTKKLQEKVDQNSADIVCIKNSIDTIKDNHLHHIEKDVEEVKKTVAKLDNRIWWVLGILVVSTVISMIGM